jgi:hypothetical protein
MRASLPKVKLGKAKLLNPELYITSIFMSVSSEHKLCRTKSGIEKNFQSKGPDRGYRQPYLERVLRGR